MKKLTKLSLAHLSEQELSSKQLKDIKGGDRSCTCSCYYEGQSGGSSMSDNCHANYRIGPGGGSSTNGNNSCGVGVIP